MGSFSSQRCLFAIWRNFSSISTRLTLKTIIKIKLNFILYTTHFCLWWSSYMTMNSHFLEYPWKPSLLPWGVREESWGGKRIKLEQVEKKIFNEKNCTRGEVYKEVKRLSPWYNFFFFSFRPFEALSHERRSEKINNPSFVTSSTLLSLCEASFQLRFFFRSLTIKRKLFKSIFFPPREDWHGGKIKLN